MDNVNESVCQAEAVDLRAEMHGGWTLDNCKMQLNEYAQRNRQAVKIDFKQSGPDNYR